MNLIATVGTSFINNLKREGKSKTKKDLKKLYNHYNLNNKIFGAEINIINKIINNSDQNIEKIYLISTETKLGKKSSEMVRYVIQNKLEINFVEIKVVKFLNKDNIYDFQNKGLKNLVNILADIIKKEGPSNLSMLPLGGFKAQIFMTGLVAQIFNIKSYYMFEDFENTIELMPLPISFDFNLFFENYTFFKELNKEGAVLKSKINSRLKKYPDLKKLINTEKIDNKNYIELSPMGELFYEKLSFEVPRRLPKPAKDKWDKVQYKNDEGHSNASFNDKTFLRVISGINKKPYVKKVVIDYYMPDNKGSQKIVSRSSSNEGAIAKLEYNHKNGLIRSKIYINNENEEELKAAIIDLQNFVDENS